MRASTIALALLLVAAAGLGGCVPDVVGIEAVPTPKLARDLARCRAETNTDGTWIDERMKHCMQAKGHQFLRGY